MLKNTFLLFALLLSLNAFAQQMHIEKTTIIGDKAGTGVFGMLPTVSGGIFFWGVTGDSSGLGDFPLCLPRNNNPKLVIGKIDINGNKEWAKIFCSADTEQAANCSVGLESFGIISPEHFINTGPTAEDLTLAKIDCQGNMLWKRRWGSSDADKTMTIIRTKDGGYLVVGFATGTDGDIPFNYRPTTTPWKYSDIIVIKTDSLGNKQWLKVFGSSTADVATKVFQVGAYYYLFANTDGLSNDHDFADTSKFPGNSYNYLLKIDSLGGLVWSRGIGGICTNGAIFDERDSTFVCTSGTLFNQPPYYNNSNNSDFGIAKVDLEANIIFAKHHGEANFSEWSRDMCKGPGNTYVLAGVCQASITTPPPHIGDQDGLIYWVDSAGNAISKKYFGTPAHDEIDALAKIGNKYIIATRNCYANNPYTEGAWHYTNGVIVGVGFTVIDLWTTGVNEIKNSVTSLNVYPNPANSKITITLPKQSETYDIRVYNKDGAMIMRHAAIKQKSFEFSTQSLANGTYFIACNDAQNILYTAQIIIEH